MRTGIKLDERNYRLHSEKNKALVQKGTLLSFACPVLTFCLLGAFCIAPLYSLTLHKFTDLKETCHKHQLAFLCGENRLRSMGDSLTCCGCEGLAGFQPSTCNLNHYVYDKEHFAYTPAMSIRGTAECFKAMGQDTKTSRFLRANSFESVMEKYLKDEKTVRAYIDKE